MYINSIRINGFKSIKNDQIINFTAKDSTVEKMNIIMGINGAGKTTLLEAIAKSLSWFESRVASHRGAGDRIEYSDININSPYAEIEINVSDITVKIQKPGETEDMQLLLFESNEELEYSAKERTKEDEEIEIRNLSWLLTRFSKNSGVNGQSNFKDLNRATEKIRQNFQYNSVLTLPTIIYYGSDRHYDELNSLRSPFRSRNRFYSESALDEYRKSLNGKVNFDRFIDWFENIENLENQRFREIFNINSNKEGSEIIKELEDFKEDPRLRFIRTALYKFLDSVHEVFIDRETRSRLSVKKNGVKLSLSQLSQGERSILVLVSDIARTLCVMNPESDDPLSAPGIILIDEVDVHLHPSWQINLIQKFSDVFPNCQFIVTTHSPLIVSSLQSGNIFIAQDGRINKVEDSFYGEDANYILNVLLGTPERDNEIDKLLQDFNKSLKSDNLNHSRKIFEQIESRISEQNKLFGEISTRMNVAELLSKRGK